MSLDFVVYGSISVGIVTCLVGITGLAAAKHHVEGFDKSTPHREMNVSEIEDFGPDATSGIVFGEIDSRRLYCVEYFDETQRAFVGKVKERIDVSTCEKLTGIRDSLPG